MSAGTAKLLELLLVIALVGGWGAHELWSLRRDRARDEAADADGEPTAGPADFRDGQSR